MHALLLVDLIGRVIGRLGVENLGQMVWYDIRTGTKWVLARRLRLHQWCRLLVLVIAAFVS